MDQHVKPTPTPPNLRLERALDEVVDAAMEGAALRPVARVDVSAIVVELRRRRKLYTSAPRGDNPAKAEALDLMLAWIEAHR